VPHDTLGRLLVERGDLPGARAELATAVGLEPGDGAIRLHLAETEYRLGRIAEACEDLRAASAVRDDPGAAEEARTLLTALPCAR